MDIITIIIICLTAFVVAGMAVGIANLARSIDRIEMVQSKEIEAFTISKKNLDDRIDTEDKRINELIVHENTWRQALEKNQEENRDEIKKILSRLDEISRDFGKLDEIDFRARQASAKAADVARCYVLNDKGAGVSWAKDYVCEADQEDEHAENDA